MKKIEFNDDEKENILKQYNLGFGYRKIAENLNIPHADAILRFLREQGKHRDFTNKGKHKFTLNENYFENIDDEHKAYWLGFLYADGCVYKNTVSIRLRNDKENIELLEKLKQDLCYNKDLIIGSQNSFGIETQFCLLNIYSKKMVEDLIEKGCLYKKSLILTYPTEKQVPFLFQKDFIRGYLDGDGSFLLGKTGKSVCFYGTLEFLTGIKNYFQIKPSPKKDTRKDKNKNIYYLSFGGKYQLQEKIFPLYKDATIYLNRKYQQFLKCII